MPFAIEDFHDLVRILEARPEWRAELRRLVLTDELLALPEQVTHLRSEMEQGFQKLTEQVAALTEAQRRTEEQVAALTEAQKRIEGQVLVLIEAQNRTDAQIASLTQAVYALTGDVRVLKTEVGDLKGTLLEFRYQDRAPAYLGRLVPDRHRPD